MSWDWARLEAKFDGVELFRTNLITVSGTWSPPQWGFQADLARGLNDEGANWIPVPYPASFGPVSPPYPGAPAYIDSVQIGVKNARDIIDAHPGKFVLAGYSQGAEVCGRICIELIEGSLKHRLKDCLGCITFGDPARQKSDENYGGGEGWGIARLKIPAGIRRITYAVPGDMYCTTPDGQVGDQMHAVYDALTKMGDGKINGLGELSKEVLKLMANPISGGIAAVQAIIRAIQVAQHNNYGKWVPHAVEKFYELTR